MSGAPLLADGPFVTDGGLETDLQFHHGFDLPEFAAFPLLEDRAGRAALDAYYDQYAAIARAAGQGLLLETPTWRAANRDWAEKIGYDRIALDRANREAVALARRAQERACVDRSLVVGVHGPRGDGYVAGTPTDPDEAAEYHFVQARSFADEGVDLVHAMTITTPEEGIGVVRAARSAGLPVAGSFTVETDGRLPDGTPLGTAVERVDAVAAPDWFGINCAHPDKTEYACRGGPQVPPARHRGVAVGHGERNRQAPCARLRRVAPGNRLRPRPGPGRPRAQGTRACPRLTSRRSTATLTSHPMSPGPRSPA